MCGQKKMCVSKGCLMIVGALLFLSLLGLSSLCGWAVMMQIRVRVPGHITGGDEEEICAHNGVCGGVPERCGQSGLPIWRRGEERADLGGEAPINQIKP